MPLSHIPPLSQPSARRLWHRLWADSPSLQVDVKHTILHSLYLLFSDLCREGGSQDQLLGPCVLGSPSPTHRRHLAPSLKQSHPPRCNSLDDQMARFLRLFLWDFISPQLFHSHRLVSVVCLNVNFVCVIHFRPWHFWKAGCKWFLSLLFLRTYANPNGCGQLP